MERIIEKIESFAPVQPKLKKVAAYARVSTAKDAMHHSLVQQMLISASPEYAVCTSEVEVVLLLLSEEVALSVAFAGLVADDDESAAEGRGSEY